MKIIDISLPHWLEENIKKGRFKKRKPEIKDYKYAVIKNGKIKVYRK